MASSMTKQDLFAAIVAKKPCTNIQLFKLQQLGPLVNAAANAGGKLQSLSPILLPLLKPFEKQKSRKQTTSIANPSTASISNPKSIGSSAAPTYTLLDYQTLLCLPYTSF